MLSRGNEDSDEVAARFYYSNNEGRASGPPLYPHSTYHGYNHHQRTPLAQANFRPLKFTDTPVSYSPRSSAERDIHNEDEVWVESARYLNFF